MICLILIVVVSFVLAIVSDGKEYNKLVMWGSVSWWEVFVFSFTVFFISAVGLIFFLIQYFKS
jgi:hypothetical protein